MTNPSEPPCGRCGQPAEGFATINDQRYCHEIVGEPTCFELAQWDKWERADPYPLHPGFRSVVMKQRKAKGRYD